MKNFQKILCSFLTLSVMLLNSCSKSDDDNDLLVGGDTSFYSEATYDGIVINSSPKTVSDFYTSGSGYKEITIGWNASGYSMRGFLSFDVSGILPPSDYKLVFDNAVLSVFEANTNLFPFADNKTVLCYLVEYGTLDASDYDGTTISSLGSIASGGLGVLTGFDLNITTALNSYINSTPTAGRYQFRLQSNSLSNVTSTSSQAQAMWNIFSGEQGLMGGNDYRPKLTIKYHYQKKE